MEETSVWPVRGYPIKRQKEVISFVSLGMVLDLTSEEANNQAIRMVADGLANRVLKFIGTAKYSM